jgi:phytoene/squalene synthetase
VGSILLPSALRAPISVIYRFARSADDIADEGVANAPTRLTQLDEYRQALNRIEDGYPS